MTASISEDRISILNNAPVKKDGQCVIYWMQHSQRADDNAALDMAIELANELKLPVVVLFVLNPDYPYANVRHFTFMLQGISETATGCRKRGTTFVTRIGDPLGKVPEAVKELNAAALITDRGYLRHQRNWRTSIADAVNIQMIEVDDDCIIPCHLIGKEEYSARTMRTKVERLLPGYLTEYHPAVPMKPAPQQFHSDFDPADINATMKMLNADDSVLAVAKFIGGATNAMQRLEYFLQNNIELYLTIRNDAVRDITSHISPYLHYGQISPRRVILLTMTAKPYVNPVRDKFYDEIIVRRELAINFTWYNPDYDTPLGWPNWGRVTLDRHRADPRPAIYSLDELENAHTHDDVWNTAMLELRKDGIIHNYARMLWGKTLLELTESPEVAWQYAVHLNDKYALDGRDSNGYTNIAWCLAGKHDRPWKERPIYGIVRYMSTALAKKRFDPEKYYERVTGEY
jgi:deoxyribodipyrimidine photo-lyase